MKKICIICIFILLSLTFLCTGTVFAEPENEVASIMILPEKDSYFVMDEPTLTDGDGQTLVVLDGSKLRSIGTYDSVLSTGIDPLSVREIKVWGQYVFVLYKTEINTVKVFNLKTSSFALYDGYSEGSLYVKEKYPISVSVRGDTLYALYDTAEIYSFKLEDKNDSLSVEEPALFVKCQKEGDLDLYRKIFICENSLYTLHINILSGFEIVCYSLENGSNSVVVSVESKGKYATMPTDFLSAFQAGTLYLAVLGDHCFIKYNGTYNEKTGSYLIVSDMTTVGDNVISLQQFDEKVSGFSVGAGKMFRSFSDEKRIERCYFEKGEIKVEKEYSYFGQSKARLNSPTDVSTFGEYVFVLDKGNGRIVRYTVSLDGDISEIKTSDDAVLSEAESICVAPDGKIYVCFGTKEIYVYDTTLTFFSAISTEKEAYDVDVDSLGKIYYKDADSGINCHGDTDFSVSVKADVFCVSEKGNTLYAVFGNTLYLYSKTDGIKINEVSLKIHEIKGIDSDYKGNVYLLYVDGNKNYIDEYIRNESSLTFSKKIKINEPYFGIVGNLTIDGNGNFLFVNSSFSYVESLSSDGIFSLSLESESNMDYPDPTQQKEDFSVIMTRTQTTLYTKPNNFETVRIVPAGEMMVVLYDIVESNDTQFYFAEYDGKKYYLKTSFASEVEESDPPFSKGVVTLFTAPVYSVPVQKQEYKVATLTDKKAVIDVEKRIGYYSKESDLGFYYVVCGEVKGYVRSDSVSIYDYEQYVTADKKFCYVKSPGVGKKVALYANASLSSDTLVSLSDGEKIELLQEYDPESQFVLVRVGNNEGYILTEYVSQRKFTFVHKILLVIAVAVVVAGLVVLIVKYDKKHLKRKGDVNNGG